LKNQYFGDINDYRKYGLLRCIADATGLDLGILWLLTEDDGRTDGEFRRYLREPLRWRHHDPPLFDRLATLLADDATRHVRHAAAWKLIPRATFFDAFVNDSTIDRQRYFADACAALAECPLLFLDPDNGIEVASVRYGNKGSSKYAYWRELASLYHRGHSLLVYQHYPRIPRATFESAVISEFARVAGATDVAVFSTAHVGFFLALQPRIRAHAPAIVAQVRSRWNGQIESKQATD
jgi:hypothetical protein